MPLWRLGIKTTNEQITLGINTIKLAMNRQQNATPFWDQRKTKSYNISDAIYILKVMMRMLKVTTLRMEGKVIDYKVKVTLQGEDHTTR